MSKRPPSDRRDFLKTTTLAGLGYWVAGTAAADDSKPASQEGPNEKIRFACIGVEGKGKSDSDDAGKHGDVVAICDIDDRALEKAAKRFPNAKKFNDYRKLLDEMGANIDAVTVSTPDHTHAVAAAAAMHMGKACFCQKPLTHSVYEARRLAEIARQTKVPTQMGNQGTAQNGLRKGAAMLRAGAVGNVQEVHVWTNRPIWPQGGSRPKEAPVPEAVHWELFLGPAPYRPYGPGYAPFAWRGWWDFGTGALGDMACHTVNLAYMGLDLRNPVSIEAQTSGHNKDSYPKWSQIEFNFPANTWRPAVKLFWYDGGKRPSKEVTSLVEQELERIAAEESRKEKEKAEGDKKPGKKGADKKSEKLKASGCLIIGDKGQLYSPDDYGAKYTMLGGATSPEVEIVESPGHFTEFANAIKGGPKAVSNFADYSGPLTETILLGNLAVWAGKKIEWDSANLKATNAPEVEPIVHPIFRGGYTL
ncbi:MAG TPA: Gfo/Idh/MocA family oxidoreductase [Pirellulales bacterium]|jgi:predicted dehydrogenase|nr:Gfo/Idh/MocA family oxidoreductase [Pirellulales bacterium]